MRLLTNWAALTRAREWDYSKAGICLLPLCWGHATRASEVSWTVWVGGLLWLVCFFAAAYLVNDLSDRACDLRAGKHRPAHDLGVTRAWAVVVAHLLVSGVAVFLLGSEQPLLTGLGLVVSYLLLFTYSLPPLRWKERGVAGLFVAAASQRVAPMVVLAAALPRLDAVTLWMMALALLQGVRWILIHQVQDMGADDQAQVQTWALQRGADLARRVLIHVVVPA